MTFQLPETEDGVTLDDLWLLTNRLINEVERMLRRCTDTDVTFMPVDLLAHDASAANADEAAIAWTLGHIIVHMTASSEESAAVASELARGVAYHGRSRSEVPWTSVTTVVQCRARLEESRRMRLASLNLWPDEPQLSNAYAPYEGARELGPVAVFLGGLRHDAGHLDQLRDVIGQARADRFRKTLLGRLRLRLRRTRSAATTAESDGREPTRSSAQ